MLFTVEEMNLMSCFDRSSRKNLMAELKSLTFDSLDEETSEVIRGAVKKLESMSDSEFEGLYIEPDSLIYD